MEPEGPLELLYYFAESKLVKLISSDWLETISKMTLSLGNSRDNRHYRLTAEIHSDEVSLKWTKPNSNGADITQYILYMGDVASNDTAGDRRKLELIYDVPILEYVVTLKKGQQYEFLVTATNKIN